MLSIIETMVGTFMVYVLRNNKPVRSSEDTVLEGAKPPFDTTEKSIINMYPMWSSG